MCTICQSLKGCPVELDKLDRSGGPQMVQLVVHNIWEADHQAQVARVRSGPDDKQEKVGAHTIWISERPHSPKSFSTSSASATKRPDESRGSGTCTDLDSIDHPEQLSCKTHNSINFSS